MATRSNIGAKQQDGTIKAIYCHWDGYPEGVGAALTEHYSDPAKVEALLNLGDISGVNDTEPENIDSYAKRGETGTEARTFQTFEEWEQYAVNQWAEYLHLYEGGKWTSLPVKVMA
jgi:ABC-type sugar transport system substrate-binding protein